MSDDLVEFIRARLDEDEQRAPLAGQIMRLRAATSKFGDRLLTEIKAKRRLLDYLVALEDKALNDNWWNLDTTEPLLLLALPYADHPDYPERMR